MSRVMDRAAAALAWALLSGALLACQGSNAPQPAAAMSDAGMRAPLPAAGGAAGKEHTPAAGSGAPAPAGTAAAEGGQAGTSPAPGAAGSGGSQAVDDFEVARSTVVANAAPATSDADYKTFISHINKFGLDLGQQVASGEFKQQNLIYSPLSATVALSMTYAGAKGATAAEMKTVLGDTFAGGVFHTASNRLLRDLASRMTSRTDPDGTVHKVELEIADAIFVDRSLALQDPFLDVLSREYDSGVMRLDFMRAFEPARMAINAWVAMQTRDKIQDLLPKDSISLRTRLVLVNALYFYGSWQAPFPHTATSNATFKALSGTSVQVPTMHASFWLGYRSADKFEVAELVYEGGKLKMTIVLPADGEFEAVRNQVSGAWLEQAVTGLQAKQLAVSLPKFKLTAGSFSLKDGLKAAGMKSLFMDGVADLSGINTEIPLNVSDVLQKAFIAVDEDGSEASAATAVIVTTPPSAPLEPPKPFTVDRPFLFFIRDETGAVLFSGHVVDPSK